MATVKDDPHVDSDEVVEYWIFPDLDPESGDLHHRLEELRAKCFAFLSELSRDYIWHDESISLFAVEKTQSGMLRIKYIALYDTIVLAIIVPFVMYS